jgi:small multidrug resistance pump
LTLVRPPLQKRRRCERVATSEQAQQGGKPMSYVYLAIAIIAEVIGTSALKASEEFTRLVPSIIVVVGYAVAFFFLSLTLRTIPVGIAYAIWAGAGIALIVAVGAVLFRQVPDLAGLVGLALIVAGVVIVNTLSHTAVH